MPNGRSNSRASSSLCVLVTKVTSMPWVKFTLSGIDLREHQLLGQAQAVVAVAVEALGIDAAEVADTRQGDR